MGVGVETVRSSLAATPVKATGPKAEGALVVLVIAPAVELVTFITTSQLVPATREAALKRTLLSPAAEGVPAMVVTVPQAAGVKLKTVSNKVNPPGNVSST